MGAVVDRTELLRVAIGFTAFLVAGAQLVMRWMIIKEFNISPGRMRKERTTSIAALLLLTGIGLGNLTHLEAQATTSTVLISIGVVWAAWSIRDLWAWGKEEADVVAHGKQPKRRRRFTDDRTSEY
jgi:amino acid transporter